VEKDGSNAHPKSKREILKDKVVALVKDFIKTEGGITLQDLESLFGLNPHQEIIAALYRTLTLS
jgi:hypothetical protein